MLNEVGVPQGENYADEQTTTTNDIAQDVEGFLNEPDIWDKIRRRVEAYCYRMGIADLSEDVFQNVALKIWRGKGKFRSDSTVGTWVYSIIHNECVDEIRSRTRELKYVEPHVPMKEQEIDPIESAPDLNGLSPELQLELQTAKEYIRSHHPGLSSDIIDLLEREGPLSVREIAELLGRSKSAVHEALTEKIRPAFEGRISFRQARKRVKKTSSSGR